MQSPPLTFEALLGLQRPTSVALSPDGQQVAFTVTPGSHGKSESPAGRLWVGVTSVEGATQTAHRTAGFPGALEWSPDGERLAFTSAREGRGGVGLSVREASGEVRELRGPDGSVEMALWSRDGSQLLVLAADLGTAGAGGDNWKVIEDPEAARDPIVTRPDECRRRLFLVDPASGEATEVGPEGVNVWEVGWSGEGKAVAIVSPGSSESAYYDAELALLDLEARASEVVYSPEWQLKSPIVSPDGACVAVVEGTSADRIATIGVPIVIEVATKEVRALGAELDAERLRWLADGSIFFVGEAGLETTCGRVWLDGEVGTIWRGPATLGQTHVHDASISYDGGIVAASKEAPGEPPEVMVLETGESGAEWTAVSSLNESLLGYSVPRTETVSWQSDGVEIEGILLTPSDREKENLPLVVVAHGGPVAAWTLNYSAGHEYFSIPLAHAGYAVLLPNPRGSTGRGQEFIRTLLGNHGPMEMKDFDAGIDSLAEQGIVDRDRVGITGLSGGGYLSAYASTRSKSFKAAVPKSSVTDWLSFHFTTNIGRFDEFFLEGDPYDPNGNHLRLSPVMYAREASTPTLILHGALDLCCPLSQAQELYQALANEGVETELVVYQQSGHALTEREYLLDMWERMRAWFGRHLG